MESDKIYEDSLNELEHIRRQFTFSEIKIDVSKLDARTKEALIYAIADVVAKRKRSITELISGVH